MSIKGFVTFGMGAVKGFLIRMYRPNVPFKMFTSIKTFAATLDRAYITSDIAIIRINGIGCRYSSSSTLFSKIGYGNRGLDACSWTCSVGWRVWLDGRVYLDKLDLGRRNRFNVFFFVRIRICVCAIFRRNRFGFPCSRLLLLSRFLDENRLLIQDPTTLDINAITITLRSRLWSRWTDLYRLGFILHIYIRQIDLLALP